MKNNLNLIEIFQLQLESRLNNYKILNGLTLLLIGFCINFLQLSKIPLLLKIEVGFFLPLFIAIFLDSKLIFNIYQVIFDKFDKREHEKCSMRLKLTIKLHFASSILTVALITFIPVNVISHILSITFISFQVSLFAIISVLLFSIKSAPYNEMNKTEEPIYNNISEEIPSEDNIIKKEIHTEQLPVNQVIINRNFLEDVFSGRTTKSYLPFFCLLEYTFFDYNKSNNEIGNWHKAIAELIGKKSGTVKITKNENYYMIDKDILKKISVALQIQGSCDINDYGIYTRVISTLKNTLENYRFILTETKIQEFKLLVTLYLYFENNKKGNPKIPDELNISSVKKKLLKKIKPLISTA